jgi:hypothetical protein
LSAPAASCKTFSTPFKSERGCQSLTLEHGMVTAWPVRTVQCSIPPDKRLARDNAVEPPIGIEPMTYALRVASWRSVE